MQNDDKDIKIVLADDHEIVRAGLIKLMWVDRSIKVLGEADNGEDAVGLVRYHKPDIAVFDIMMPKMDGIEATGIIRAEFPDIPVVVLTAFEDADHIEQAIAAGAAGYLSKDINAKDLVESLRKVYHGERVFSSTILNILRKKKNIPENTVETQISISKREQQVLDLVAQGMTSPQIGEKLFISVRTVQSHRANLMDKLGVKNSAELIRYALSHEDTSPRKG